VCPRIRLLLLVERGLGILLLPVDRVKVILLLLEVFFALLVVIGFVVGVLLLPVNRVHVILLLLEVLFALLLQHHTQISF